MSDFVREVGKSAFVGTWNYHLPKYEPDREGDIMLLFRCCFGPAEWWCWGIDAKGHYFEEYRWCENELFESESYREEITQEKLLDMLRSAEELFRENGVTKYADAYREAQKYILGRK